MNVFVEHFCSNCFRIGSTFQIHWNVRNDGYGPTVQPSWRDAVVFNATENTGTTALANRHITQSLFPGNEYEVVMNVTIPKYITGKYNIYVVVNVYKQEFEYRSYDNNVGRSVRFICFLFDKLFHISGPKIYGNPFDLGILNV